MILDMIAVYVTAFIKSPVLLGIKQSVTPRSQIILEVHRLGSATSIWTGEMQAPDVAIYSPS